MTKPSRKPQLKAEGAAMYTPMSEQKGKNWEGNLGRRESRRV